MFVGIFARLAGLSAGLAVCVESCDYGSVVDFPDHIVFNLSGEAVVVHGKVPNTDVPPAGHVLVIVFRMYEGKP